MIIDKLVSSKNVTLILKNNQLSQSTKNSKEEDVLSSISPSKIILPIVLGIGVVIYLITKSFDTKLFNEINWTGRTLYWVLFSIVLLTLRHLAYAGRLYTMTDKQFSYKKCIKLIFMWEFSSAVSPTSLGGSAVAIFILSKEKLGTAKTTAIVIYSIILDTFFFISTLFILILVLGPIMLRPGLESFETIDGWGKLFVMAYGGMLVYGSFFAYGLFFRPQSFATILKGLTSFSFMKRFRPKAVQLGEEIVIASKEIKQKNLMFHVKSFFFTSIAWSFRFLLLSCLIIGFVPEIALDILSQTLLYGRLESMFVIMAFSPTPGGAGLAEIVFDGFLSDFVPSGLSLIIAFIWRLLSYYSYLIAGAIIIPSWIRQVYKK